MCRLRWEKVEPDQRSFEAVGEVFTAKLQPLYNTFVYQDEGLDAPNNWFFSINDTGVGGPFLSASEAKGAAEEELFEMVTKFYRFLGGSITDQELRERSSMMRLRSMEATNFLVWNQLRRARKPESDQLEKEISALVEEVLTERARKTAPGGVAQEQVAV